MNVAIIGFGKEGQSVLQFLQNRGLTRTDADEIWILDKNRQKAPHGAKTRFGKNYLKNLERFDIVFRSPGVPYNLPELVMARKNGVKLSSATKLFFDEISRLKPSANGGKTSHLKPCVVGITGTKGKGTTATLLYKILRAHSTSSGQAARNIFLAGNIGKPALDILPKLNPSASLRTRKARNSWVILELSSFQLQDLKVSPHIAVVLDIFSDHQDKHLSLAEYYASKANIAKYQKRGDKILFFRNNKLSNWVARQSNAKKISVDENNFKLFRPEDLKIIGNHNFKNAVMAATVALKLGIHAKIVVKTVKNFRGLPHRLQLARTITEKTRGSYSHILKNMRIRFYNDSAAVNPGATVAAIMAICDKRQETKNKPSSGASAEEKQGTMNKLRAPLSHVACRMSLILIAGGMERGLNYSGLARAIKKYAGGVVLFGENKKAIAGAISGQRSRRHRGLDGQAVVGGQKKTQIVFAKTLKEAVQKARRRAQTLTTNHLSLITILFSPASASFDMFKNYEERGGEFVKIVKKIKVR